MANLHTYRLLLCLLAALITTSLSLASEVANTVSKDQIECTMCSACNNPCGQYSQPPPQQQQQQPPYYYPPPRQPTYTYQPPPPYGGGGGYYYPPSPPKYGGFYPVPPPPDPIVPYFPFFYHTPPPAHPSMSNACHFRGTVATAAAVISVLLGLF